MKNLADLKLDDVVLTLQRRIPKKKPYTWSVSYAAQTADLNIRAGYISSNMEGDPTTATWQELYPVLTWIDISDKTNGNPVLQITAI